MFADADVRRKHHEDPSAHRDGPAYDDTRCFVTHSTADPELVEFAKKQVAEIFSFKEILETVAGSVITGHCGRNTLGVLFIAR